MIIDGIQHENISGSIGADDADAPGTAPTYRRRSSGIIDDLCKAESIRFMQKRMVMTVEN